jgi:hypothetical protein
MGWFVTARDTDISRLARLSGLGSLPYRSFQNPPVRRAPAPPAPPREPARPTATVLALSPGAGDGAPVLRVITGMGGLSARPLPAMRPGAEHAAAAAFAERPAAMARPPAVAPGFGLLSRALGEEVAPPPPAAPLPASAGQDGRASFPLLNAALSAGGGSPWR